MSSKSNIQSEDTAYRGITRYYNKDWNIEAFNILRNKIQQKEYTNLNIEGHSIYFLYGEDEEGNLKVYVGRSSDTTKSIPVFTRLHQHKISTTESYCDEWDSAIAISFKNLSFDEMRNLENYFYHSLLTPLRINSVEPDTNAYKYESIQHKVEYIKSFVNFILKEDVFKSEKKQEAVKDVPRLNYSDKELKNQGKRLVDKDFETITEIQTHLDTVEIMLDLLPKHVWGPNTKFLDLACKSGEYLKAVFNRLLASDLYKGTPYEDTVTRTLHILSEQLYGVALSDESLTLTKENINDKVNVIKLNYKKEGSEVQLHNIISKFNFIEKEISNLKELHVSGNKPAFNRLLKLLKQNKQDLLDMGITEDTFEQFLKNQFGVDKDMKFDVVIGNPPYQETTGGGNNGGKAIYDSFIKGGLKMSDNLCMIVKNNWMNSESLKDVRENILNSGLKTLVNYSLLGDVFPDMGIAASIINIDKNYTGNIHYTEIQKKELINQYVEDIRDIGDTFIPASKYEYGIVKSVKSQTKTSFGQHVVGISPFGINTNGKISKDEYIDESVIPTDYYNISIKYEGHTNYTNISCFSKNINLVNKYKVICPKQIHKTNNPIPSVINLLPNQICSASYSLMYYDDNMERANNVAKYIQTKFFRFLTYCLADSLCGLTSYRVSLVPDQDYTSKSDIDWSQSIENIDQQLYKKYNLTLEEINYIESTIKPMDSETKKSSKPSKPKETQTKPSKLELTQQDAAAAFINKMVNNQ